LAKSQVGTDQKTAPFVTLGKEGERDFHLLAALLDCWTYPRSSRMASKASSFLRKVSSWRLFSAYNNRCTSLKVGKKSTRFWPGCIAKSFAFIPSFLNSERTVVGKRDADLLFYEFAKL
jgi:hypothetical protein